jgi:hypothetical protein
MVRKYDSQRKIQAFASELMTIRAPIANTDKPLSSSSLNLPLPRLLR